MGRLRKELIERTDAFADRILDIVLAVRQRGCPSFVRDQLGRSGTSVGSNACEADEAITVPEFRHRRGIALRELGGTRHWLTLVARRAWVAPVRLTAIQGEAEQLSRILAAILNRSAPGARRTSGAEMSREPSSAE